jgi:hypothetical protein
LKYKSNEKEKKKKTQISYEPKDGHDRPEVPKVAKRGQHFPLRRQKHPTLNRKHDVANHSPRHHRNKNVVVQIPHTPVDPRTANSTSLEIIFFKKKLN